MKGVCCVIKLMPSEDAKCVYVCVHVFGLIRSLRSMRRVCYLIGETEVHMPPQQGAYCNPRRESHQQAELDAQCLYAVEG